MRKISIDDFLIDTAEQISYFLDRANALVHDIERDAERKDFTQTAIHCGIISCDLDDLDDLKDRIWKYENGLPKKAAHIYSRLDAADSNAPVQ